MCSAPINQNIIPPCLIVNIPAAPLECIQDDEMVLPSRNEWDRGTAVQRPLLLRRIPRSFLKRRHCHNLFIAAIFLALMIYRIRQIPVDDILQNGKVTTTATLIPPNIRQTITLKDAKGNVVSREREALRISDFLQSSTNNDKNNNTTVHSSMTFSEAKQGREPILRILQDAGIKIDEQSDVENVLQLPTWKRITHLYGEKPVILGLDQCEAFRQRVAETDRFLAVAGNFNSGTTAFGLSLQANCNFPNRRRPTSGEKDDDDPYSNDKVSHVNGMLSQVPWAKHKMSYYRNNHTILATVPKDDVLPIVLVRDPYFWMQSMCRQGYGLRWDHQEQHCPNLVPNEYDFKRFGKKWARQGRQNETTIKVWMGANLQSGPSWDSLAHYWNAWYESYMNVVDWPRLMIRFEDTLFHPKQVMQEVCKCGGGQLREPFSYLVGEAKWNHKQAQNNMVTAMIKYGSGKGRYHNMTAEDLAFAKTTLDASLLDTFGYQGWG